MVLTSSWGYDQTNVDFFKVLKVSKSFVTIRKLQSSTTEITGYMQGKSVPADEFNPHHSEIRRKVHGDDMVRIESYAWAKPWDGKPEDWSSYA